MPERMKWYRHGRPLRYSEPHNTILQALPAWSLYLVEWTPHDDWSKIVSYQFVKEWEAEGAYLQSWGDTWAIRLPGRATLKEVLEKLHRSGLLVGGLGNEENRTNSIFVRSDGQWLSVEEYLH